MTVSAIKRFIFASALLLAGLLPAQAIELRVTPALSSVTLTPGERVIVAGTITNLTGTDLLTNDIFLSFSAYAPDYLQIDQLLGLDEFALPDRTISDEIALFSIIALGAPAGATTLPFEFFAIDINGVVSTAQTFVVVIAADTPPADVPEPAMALLFLMGAGCLYIRTRQRRRPMPGTGN